MKRKFYGEAIETLADTIQKAMEDLVNVECPTCETMIDLPSFENIAEWAKKREQC